MLIGFCQCSRFLLNGIAEI